MKRFIRCVSLILVFALVLVIPVSGVEAVSERSSNYFLKSTVYLYETSATSFETWFHVTGVGTMEKIGASVIKIQRSSDNANWTTVKTFEMANYPSMVCDNTFTHVSCVTYTGTSGYYYRAYIKLYAKDSSGSAVWTRYTESIYIA